MRAFVYGKEIELGSEFNEFVDRSRTAIVSIDMHNGHLSDSPDCPCPAPRAREIVQPINEFHRSARAMDVPVIHVKSVLRAGGEDDIKGQSSAWRKTFALYVGEIPNSDQHALEGTQWTELVTEVVPSDLHVACKKRLSAFYPTDLDFLLRNMGISRLVLNGGMTDCCVLNTTFDAANLGYRVVVLADLVRGTNAELEDAALKIVSIHLGLVMTSDNLLGEWSRHRSD
jgi:nicotinamidase-related amidase